ncbi:MAG: NusG domain II-containing protein [Bacillota bacterium]
MKKGDYLILFLLILSGLSWLLINNLWKDTDLKQIVIEVDGAYYDTVDLEKEQLFQIKFPENRYIELAIKDGEVWVNDETVICPRKICVQTGKINAVGQSIVCLPNKTVIYITSQGNSSKAEPIIDEVVF